MCVLFFGHQIHPRHRLVFAGNRDEYYRRPTKVAGMWDDHPDILAGRDLEAGGTWLGATRGGRWAVVTNVRDLAAHRDRDRSRGDLVKDYLVGSETPESAANRVFAERDEFNPFNLILGDAEAVWITSTHTDAPRALAPGIYGLSNATLDEPWPKVQRGRVAFENVLAADEIEVDACLNFLHDAERAPDQQLPNTGVSKEMERMLSSLFIASDCYGTRASTVVTLGESGGRFVERTYGVGGVVGETLDFSL